MLVLAVHSVAQVTAKVPFAVILLQDFITNKKVPEGHKCRQMIPSSGTKSCSLWDTKNPEDLLSWLNENINVDCVHEVYEVRTESRAGNSKAAESLMAKAPATHPACRAPTCPTCIRPY
jgi:hypothetical protein